MQHDEHKGHYAYGKPPVLGQPNVNSQDSPQWLLARYF